jgi:RNA polymerase sigma factor (sigma-70 family)
MNISFLHKDKVNYELEDNFEELLSQLKAQHQRAWEWLVGKFRKRLLPMLHYRSNNYPSSALQTKSQFVEEVIEESIIKFSDLLPAGTFKSYSDLEAMIVTVAGFKLKEGFARLKKEMQLHTMESDDLVFLAENSQRNSAQEESEKAHMILTAREAIKHLNPVDQNILNRFFDGDELIEIAETLGISPEACRKRKQRALESLRDYFFRLLKTLLFFIWTII